MRKRLIAGSLALIALSAAAGVATAQQGGSNPGQERGHGRGQAQARIDTNGDSRVSQAEFVQARVARLSAADANKDGTVTPEEVSARIQAKTAERATARFDRADTDNDGVISRAEFDAAFQPRGDRAEAGRHGGGRHGRGSEGRGPRRVADHDGMGGNRTDRRRGERMTQPVVIADVQARATQTFAQLDTDHDGFLSAAEQQAGRAAMREKFRERRVARQAARQAQAQAPNATSASPSTTPSE